MSGRQEDTLKLERGKKERGELKKSVDALLADVRRDNREAERAFERGRSRDRSGWQSGEERDGVRGRERRRSSFRGGEVKDEGDRKMSRDGARSSFRGDDARDMERGGGRNKDKAPSGYRGPEWERERISDSVK